MLCADCFGSYLQSKISDGKVMEDELVCPVTDERNKLCKTAITVEQVRGGVSNDTFNKFCTFRASGWEPAEKDGRLVRCPSPDCCVFVVPHHLDEAACPT